MDRILNMILRQVMRRVMNRGIDAGVGHLARRRGDAAAGGDTPDPDQARRLRASQNQARGALRTMRRLGRF